MLIIGAMILCLLALTLTISQYKGKPNLAPISATVNIASNPIAPTVLDFANPTGILAGPYNPVQGGLAPTHLSILVEDLNGNQQLPGDSTFPIIISGPNSNILSGIFAPTTAPIPEMSRNSVECQPIECNSPEVVGSGLSCNPGRESIQRIYSCSSFLLQSDPPGNWRFSMSITDSTGLSSFTLPNLPPISGDPGFPEFVVYNTLSAFFFGIYDANIQPPSFVPQSFVWDALTITGTNQITSNGLTIINMGNTPSNSISITGTDLVGVNNPLSILNKNAFTLSGVSGGIPPAECVLSSNTITLSGTPQTIPGAIVPYTQAASTLAGFDTEVIYGCIPNTLISSISGVPDSQYKTPINQNWDLTI